MFKDSFLLTNNLGCFPFEQRVGSDFFRGYLFKTCLLISCLLLLNIFGNKLHITLTDFSYIKMLPTVERQNVDV